MVLMMATISPSTGMEPGPKGLACDIIAVGNQLRIPHRAVGVGMGPWCAQLDRRRAAAVRQRSRELIAVAGQSNQDKGDSEPALWMPANVAFRCQYAMQFIAVLRGYGLPVDAPSAVVLRDAAATCPAG